MRKINGFTLVELLAVIVILGILVSFSTVSVIKIKKNQDEQNKENVISSILTGAKSCNAVERKNDCLLVEYLLKNDYVDFDINKYSDLYSSDINVTKSQCTDNSLKVEYKIEVDGTTYNDCGCDEQVGDTPSSKLCK